MFEQILSFLAFPELLYTAFIFLSLILFTPILIIIVVREKSKEKSLLSLKDILPIFLLITITLVLFICFVLQISPIFTESAQSWKYIEQAKIIKNKELSLNQKLEQVPDVHSSHPSGYGFLLSLFIESSGNIERGKFLGLVIFVVSIILSYLFLKLHLKKIVPAFFITLLLIFLPTNLSLLWGWQTELLVLPLLILLAFLTNEIKEIVRKSNLKRGNSMMSKQDKFKFIMLLLTILGICNVKFEYGVVILFLPFIIYGLPIRENKLFFSISLAIFFLLITPLFYHILYFNSNEGNPFSLISIIKNIQESPLPKRILVWIFILAPLFFYLRLRDPLYLYPTLFNLAFLGFKNTTIQSFRYMGSFVLIFSFMLWRLFLEYPKFSKRIKFASITLLIAFVIINNVFLLPEVIRNNQRNKETINNILEIAVNYSNQSKIIFAFTYSELISPSIRNILMNTYNKSETAGFVPYDSDSKSLNNLLTKMLNEESSILLLISPYPFNLSQVFDGIPEEQIHVRKYEEFLFFNLSKQG